MQQYKHKNRYKNKYHTSIICIDSYNGKILNGRLYNEFLDGVVYFKSTMEFILSMSDILTKMDYPMPFLETRMFNSPIKLDLHPKKYKSIKNGILETFSVRIVFCQNSSWQGKVSWLKNGQEKKFRSVLELLIMFDSALQ